MLAFVCTDPRTTLSPKLLFVARFRCVSETEAVIGTERNGKSRAKESVHYPMGMCLHFAYLVRTAFDAGPKGKREAMAPLDVKDAFKSVEPYWLGRLYTSPSPRE